MTALVDLPAMPSGPVVDITDELENAIEQRKPWVLKPGRWGITRPIGPTPFKSGFPFIGQGPVNIEDNFDNWGYYGTTVEYIGDTPCESMFLIRSKEVTLDGISFYGHDKAETAITAYKGGAKGISAPGKWDIGFVRFEAFNGFAMQLGTDPWDHHCDEIVGRHVQAVRCGGLLKVINGQSMVHRFDHVHLYITPQGFEYVGGGCLQVGSATVLHSCVLLTLDPQDNQMGSANSVYKIADIKVDAQGAKGLQLLNTKRHVWHGLVDINGPSRFSQYDQNEPEERTRPLVDTVGGVKLNITKCGPIPDECIKAQADGAYKLNIRFQDCTFTNGSTLSSRFVPGFKSAWADREDCQSASGTKLPNSTREVG